MPAKGTTWKPTKETRKKMSEAAKGRTPCNKGLKNHPSCKGFTGSHSEETKAKISKSRKGKDLGNSHGFKKGQESWNKGITHNVHDEEWRRKVSEANSGPKHWNWKGGIDLENRRLRNSAEHKDWSKSVYARDYWTCQLCSYKGNSIVAHHIKSWAEHPDLRFEISNGRTLCRSCHIKIHKPRRNY